MFVRRVAVVELVLNKAVEITEFGDVSAENSEVMHQSKGATDLSLAGKNGEEGLASHACILECAVDQV